MAQGTRRRWVRIATTGFGLVLCTGLVGCTNWDKPKDTKAAKQPGQGLPGTPQLPNNGAAANTKAGQPGIGQPYGGPGANLQQAGFATTGAGGGRVGTTGQNTNTSPPQQFNFGPAQPNNPGGIGSGTLPGAVNVQPAGGIGGPVGNAPVQNAGAVAQAGYTPPPVNLDNIPLPPSPPTGAAGRGEFGSGPIQPPTPGPISPPPTPPGAGPTYSGKGNF